MLLHRRATKSAPAGERALGRLGQSGLRLARTADSFRLRAPARPGAASRGGRLRQRLRRERRAVAVSPPTPQAPIATATHATRSEKPRQELRYAPRRGSRPARASAFGRPVSLHGLLMSSAGLPLAGQPVAILTAPDNGSNAFTQAAAVTTGPDGSWTATLPPGPVADHRGLLPGLADDPARHRVRDRDHAGQDRADERHAGSDPVGQHGQDHRAGAGRVHPGEQQAAAA